MTIIREARHDYPGLPLNRWERNNASPHKMRTLIALLLISLAVPVSAEPKKTKPAAVRSKNTRQVVNEDEKKETKGDDDLKTTRVNTTSVNHPVATTNALKKTPDAATQPRTVLPGPKFSKRKEAKANPQPSPTPHQGK